ncbi:hypothetical protein D3C79_1017670 [compost metagenome]
MERHILTESWRLASIELSPFGDMDALAARSPQPAASAEYTGRYTVMGNVNRRPAWVVHTGH